MQQSKHSPSLITTLNAFSEPLNSWLADFVSPCTIYNAQRLSKYLNIVCDIMGLKLQEKLWEHKHATVMHKTNFQFSCYLKSLKKINMLYILKLLFWHKPLENETILVITGCSLSFAFSWERCFCSCHQVNH